MTKYLLDKMSFDKMFFDEMSWCQNIPIKNQPDIYWRPLQDSSENILVPKLHLMPQTDTKDRSYKNFSALKKLPR
jgi:hypothetical protein